MVTPDTCWGITERFTLFQSFFSQLFGLVPLSCSSRLCSYTVTTQESPHHNCSKPISICTYILSFFSELCHKKCKKLVSSLGVSGLSLAQKTKQKRIKFLKKINNKKFWSFLCHGIIPRKSIAFA